MKLVSVNIGQERTIQNAKPSGKTGIFKEPVGEAQITRLGLPGDAIVDTKNHGGPEQAVYVFTVEDYEWWSKEIGRSLAPGTFGENLTVKGLESAGVCIGNILVMGEVKLQATAPRIPCKTLAARLEDPDFIQKFRQAERPGFYCRVLSEGMVRSGMNVSLEPYPGPRITIQAMMRDWYERDSTEVEIRQYLETPLAGKARQRKEKQLKQTLLGEE
jgi:MOSC domain-containing protein YiiM